MARAVHAAGAELFGRRAALSRGLCPAVTRYEPWNASCDLAGVNALHPCMICAPRPRGARTARNETEAARLEPELIVLAGGRGTRLGRVTRTLTGRETPKQFCRFAGGRSLLQETVSRTMPLIPAERVTVVVTGDQAAVAASQLVDLGGARLMVQPADRGTATGLLLPLLELRARRREACVVVVPADHAFSDSDALLAVLGAACERSTRHPREVALIGVEPDAPRPDFGWIVMQPQRDGEGFAPVARFEEKPTTARASELMASGALFNTLILVGRCEALLAMFEAFAPELLRALADMGERAWQRRSEEVFAALTPIDLSRDILARATNLVVTALAAGAGWTDLGDEARLLRWLRDQGHHAEAAQISRGM